MDHFHDNSVYTSSIKKFTTVFMLFSIWDTILEAFFCKLRILLMALPQQQQQQAEN